ncbi:MAG: hypothetical protein U1F77_00550 [Kiritimatiellia bacterium]
MDPILAAAEITRHMAQGRPDLTTPILARMDIPAAIAMVPTDIAALAAALRHNPGRHDPEQVRQFMLGELARHAIWMSIHPGSMDAWACAQYVAALGPSGVLPPEWLDVMLAADQRVEPAGSTLTLEILLLRKEWGRLLELTREQLRLEPRTHGHLRYLSEALIGLGRDREALPHLRAFTEICQDSPFRPQALRELERIQNSQGH